MLSFGQVAMKVLSETHSLMLVFASQERPGASAEQPSSSMNGQVAHLTAIESAFAVVVAASVVFTTIVGPCTGVVAAI